MEFPEDLRYTREHEWARRRDGKVVVGITDFAQDQLGDVVYVELPDVETYHTLVGQVKKGTVPEAAINDAVRRLLRDKFELGLFEDPSVDPARADEVSGSEAARPLALEAARQAIVLLSDGVVEATSASGVFVPSGGETINRKLGRTRRHCATASAES